jgi:hypothetical protein
MFIFAVTPIHSNPIEDAPQQTIFASTWRQVGRLVRAHAEANRALFDDVTSPHIHPDFGLTFEVTKGADTRYIIVTPAVNPNGTITLFKDYYTS